ncbi:hypothetical protein D3C77_721430 [compost metagenome]
MGIQGRLIVRYLSIPRDDQGLQLIDNAAVVQVILRAPLLVGRKVAFDSQLLIASFRTTCV